MRPQILIYLPYQVVLTTVRRRVSSMPVSSAYQVLIVYFVVGCIISAASGSCINRIPLLTGFYNLVSNNNRINASSSVQDYPPWNVRMTSNGWCSVSLSSMCDGNISRAMEQYVLVDFGAEVVVEAIGTAAASNGHYLASYTVEYARSDGQYFTVPAGDGTLFDGNSACTQTEQVQQFGTPVIARYMRIIPMEWIGPMICFKMELYGCFVRECPEINYLSDNRTLLPDDNVYESTTYSAIVGTEDDVREAWCAQGTDNTPNVILTFTQPLYITYAITRGVSIYWLREYLYYYVTSSVTLLYTDVDGTSVYGQTDNGQYTVLFWEPIDTSELELRIDDYVPIFACVGIKLYGCVSSEAINHSTTTSIDPSTSINTTISDMSDNLIVNTETTIATVTTTSTVTATPSPVAGTVTITVTHTPSPLATQYFNQQTDEDEYNCNAVFIPGLAIAVTVIMILCIVIFVVTWKLKHRKVYDGSCNVRMINIDNGYREYENMDSSSWKRHKGNELQYALNTSPPSTKDNNSRQEIINLQYVSAGDQQFTVNADDINDQPLTPNAIVTALKDDPTLTDNPAYVANTSHPLLADNPAYVALKDGPPFTTTSY